jgi:hypothetical protein
MSVNSTYDIEIRYSGNTLYQAVFQAAADRWEQIIVADIADVNSGTYGFIDDLLIDASVIAIDGTGGILGRAGPDAFRGGSFLPYHGEVEFDQADVAQMYSQGTLYYVVLHEIGHILGIGTLWDEFGLIDASTHRYFGANALAQYRIASGNFNANFIPIEDGGGPGTANSHWDEETFDAELMTGYSEGPGVDMPISAMTIGSLADLGYSVNLQGGPAVNGAHVLWRHSEGAVSDWVVSGGLIAQNSSVGTLSTAWRFQDSADFSNDGQDDVLWRHDSGQVVLWTMNGTQFVSTTLPTIGNDWRNEGAADFDGNGSADVLWTNGNGQVALWMMTGSQITENRLLATLDNSWHVQELADFNGDVRSDVVLRHDSGQVVVWTMSGGQIVANQSVATVGLDWNIVGAGDFDGDGHDDILWRNDSGQVVLWQMNGAQIVSNTSIAIPGNDWHIQSVDDLNQDGRSDVLLRHNSGQVVVWEMNGSHIASNHTLTDPNGSPARIGLDWTVQTHHYDVL